MSKKIILALVVVLSVVMVFAACNKDEEYENKPGEQTEEPSKEIEVLEDENGNKYVINIEGDKVPLIDEDGFNIAPEDAVNMEAPDKAESSENTIVIGDGTSSGSEASVDWNDIAN